MLSFPLPQNWRDHVTEEERQISNRWSMYGNDCIQKVGRFWDSTVPGYPLCKTRKEAYEALSRFVCDAIPLRCANRAGPDAR
jgi:hypothetical protein